MPVRARLASLLPLAALLGVLAGCDNTFAPRADGPPYFAVYGTLDALSGTQLVRVEDVQGAFNPDTTALHARVTLTDRTSGAVVTGRDSLLTLADGTHAFAVRFAAPVQDGHPYTLTAERPDDPGARTVVEVTVGGAPSLTVFPPSENGDVLSQRLNLAEGGRSFSAVAVQYRVERTATGEAYTTAFPLATQPVAGGIGVTVPLSSQFQAIRAALGLPSTDTEALALRQVALTFVQARRDGAVVRDGYGEVGWRSQAVAPWRLAPGAVLALGLVDAQGG